MKKCLNYVLAVLFAAPALAMAATNLVNNGSFEADAQSNGTWSIYSSIAGWTGNPNIELRNNVAGTAYDGNNFVELDTHSNSWMSQHLTGPAGFYELSFWYSARPGTRATNDLSFSFDERVSGTVLNGVGNSGNEHAWQHFSQIINFDGNGLLTFSATGISDSYGGSLDKVSFVSVVPEPEVYAMLLVGLILVGSRKRRKKENFV